MAGCEAVRRFSIHFVCNELKWFFCLALMQNQFYTEGNQFYWLARAPTGMLKSSFFLATWVRYKFSQSSPTDNADRRWVIRRFRDVLVLFVGHSNSKACWLCCTPFKQKNNEQRLTNPLSKVGILWQDKPATQFGSSCVTCYALCYAGCCDKNRNLSNIFQVCHEWSCHVFCCCDAVGGTSIPGLRPARPATQQDKVQQ